jgi:CDP-diacylglycerol--serine O-phosphatidyltransferase
MSGPADARPEDVARAEGLRAFPPAALLGWANATTSAVAAAGLAGLMVAAAHPRLALTLLGAAAALDRLDGFLARRLRQSSAFGAELDSLADALAFCALPAVAARDLLAPGPGGDAVAVLFAVCGLWRLAYFNVHGLQPGAAGGRFRGVPSTVAASWLLVLGTLLLHVPRAAGAAGADLAMAALALLMISRLPYPKDGPATLALYGLVPAAAAALWLWRG